MADEQKPIEQKPVATEVPKNKGEWDKLRQDDPIKWGELTQANADTYFRQSREAQEKLTAAEQRERNLLAELNKLKTSVTTPSVASPTDGQTKIYGNGVYPQTKDEWNDLAIEDPIFAVDLRNEYNQRQYTVQNEYAKAREDGVKKLISEHSDMYHCEVDETGKLKLDKDGRPIVKIDPQTGLYAFNATSEKGKLWQQIWEEDPQGWQSLKNAPSVMMTELEKRLRQKGANMINEQSNSSEIDQSGVIGQGVPPPKAPPLNLTEEEKVHAQSMVNKGVYKSLEDYQEWKGKASSFGYAEKNSRPDFTKK